MVQVDCLPQRSNADSKMCIDEYTLYPQFASTYTLGPVEPLLIFEDKS